MSASKIVGVAVLAAGCLCAEDWPGAGIYTASDPADFVNADDASLPFVMGEGRLDWTGGDATVTRDLSFWAPQYRANAFKVSDANATLTLAGKFTQTNGCFIKTGPGTLALTYHGWQQLGKGPQNASLLGRTVMWDETTGACTNGGFAHVTVDEGTLVLGAPGATNNITSMTFIGNRTQKYAALDITNGVVVQPNNWFCIARGTGQTSNDARAEVFVRKGARLEVNQLNIGYANGMGSAFPRASLTVDGGTVSVPYQIFTLETGNGEAHVVITNGASFVNNYWNAVDAGWQMKNGSGGTSYVDISASSTGSAHYVSLRANTFLNVTGKSLFEADRTMPNGVNYERGNVTFDDSTLSSRMEGIDPLWFYGYGTNRFFVGQHGMTFHAKTGTDAALYAPVDVAGSTTRANAPLKKTGPGSLALALPYQHPLMVEEGDLRLRNLSHNWEQMPSQTPTLAAGSHLIAAGEGALGRLTVPAGTPLVLRAQGLETSQHACWHCMGWAAVRPDGFLSLTDGRATSYGSAHLKNKVDVSKSFTLSFDVVPRAFFRNAGTLYGGFMVALNSANYNLIGANGRDYLGYRYGTFTNAANKSVAMGLDATNRRLTTGANGAFGATTASLGVSVLTLLTSLDAPHRCTLAYDKDAGTLTFTFRTRDGFERSIAQSVNLQTALGATTAYLGFTAASHIDSPVDYLISNVAFADPATPAAMRVGGQATASSAVPLSAELVASPDSPAFVMDKLTYSDGAVLDVSQAETGGKAVPWSAEPLTNTNDWTLAGGAHWRADGSLATSWEKQDPASASHWKGYAWYKKPIPVAQDWTIDYDYEFGERGGGVRADCINFAIVTDTRNANEMPDTGFNMNVRYYDTTSPASQPTKLNLYNRGTRFLAVADCSPVHYYNSMGGHMRLVHEAAAQRLTIVLSDVNGAYTNVVENFDLSAMLGGASQGYLRFYGNVGGSWTENVVSNLRFESATEQAPAYATAGLGFDTWNGTGTLVKRGDGALAVVSTNASHVAVRVEEGGLLLAKELVNDHRDTGRGGFIFSDPSGIVGEKGGFVVGETKINNANDAHLNRRVRAGGSWRFTADLFVIGTRDWDGIHENEWGADAICLFFHNDPRGTQYRGLNNYRGGFANSIQNGWGFGFHTYTGTSQQRMTWGTTDFGFTDGHSASYAPIALKNRTTTHFELTHDAAAKTLKVVMTQGANCVTNDFTGVDIASAVGGEYAWLGLGSGGGRAHVHANWHNVSFEQIGGADDFASNDFLQHVDFTAAEPVVQLDSRYAGGVFRLAETVTLAGGSTLRAATVAQPAVLSVGTLSIGETAGFAADDGATIHLDAVSGTPSTVALDGGTFELGTLPENKSWAFAELRLTHGAKVRLPSGGSLRVHDVYLDGVKLQSKVFEAGDAPWLLSGKVVTREGTVFLLR